ncbi:MAG: hypothetical protein A2V98_09575 [Planctomycetes bacterium RBG_16_64_12]|nr:MAG: hypothetical protein A2V98_09575 [Planctomycetes bacterium RBG_16_64_12]
MSENDPRHWGQWLSFNPAKGTVVREPPGEGPGYWAGAPGVTYHRKLERFYMVYRLRRPRGLEPDRGAEIRIAYSRDGVTFQDVWSGTKDQLGTSSIERCALMHLPDGGWRLYPSYVDPADGRWMIGLVEADAPDAFDLSKTRPVLTAAHIATEGVKDPFIFYVAGLYHMVVSHATVATPATPEELHGTHDAYNTGLILSASGLATSTDGVAWRWEGEILRPNQGAWDGYASRISTLWYRAPVWHALYDGSANVSENYEERCGLAYSFDLRSFHRVTRAGPLFQSPETPGALRYFDVLTLPDVTCFYYEIARPDGSHELRVYRAPPGD